MRFFKLNNAAVGRKEKANTNGKDGYPYLNKGWLSLFEQTSQHLVRFAHPSASSLESQGNMPKLAAIAAHKINSDAQANTSKASLCIKY